MAFVGISMPPAAAIKRASWGMWGSFQSPDLKVIFIFFLGVSCFRLLPSRQSPISNSMSIPSAIWSGLWEMGLFSPSLNCFALNLKQPSQLGLVFRKSGKTIDGFRSYFIVFLIPAIHASAKDISSSFNVFGCYFSSLFDALKHVYSPCIMSLIE